MQLPRDREAAGRTGRVSVKLTGRDACFERQSEADQCPWRGGETGPEQVLEIAGPVRVVVDRVAVIVELYGEEIVRVVRAVETRSSRLKDDCGHGTQ